MILKKTRTLKDLDPYIYEGRGWVKRITTHWTGGTYSNVDYSAYHVVIGHDGTIYVTRHFNESGAHVANRNTHNLGISMACCGDMGIMYADGTVSDWGTYPPTDIQVDKMSEVLAYLMIGIGVPYQNVKDHHYYASIDGYGSDRVDIMALPQEPGKYGNDILLGKALWYANLWGINL